MWPARAPKHSNCRGCGSSPPCPPSVRRHPPFSVIPPSWLPPSTAECSLRLSLTSPEIYIVAVCYDCQDLYVLTNAFPVLEAIKTTIKGHFTQITRNEFSFSRNISTGTNITAGLWQTEIPVISIVRIMKEKIMDMTNPQQVLALFEIPLGRGHVKTV